MKSILKALLPLTLCAAPMAYAIDSSNCGGHGQDSYYFNSVAKGTTVKINLSGIGNVNLAQLVIDDPTASIGQDFNLKNDCTFESFIYGVSSEGRANLYQITGTWSYPAESKTIYFALDGDVSQGDNADPDATTWGRLLAGALSIPNVMPLIFNKKDKPEKLTAFEATFPSITTKTATIVPGKNGSAKATMSIIGKGIAVTPKGRKEASFSFTSTVKAVEYQ